MDGDPTTALNYLHQAQALRKIARELLDQRTSESLMEIADDYEQRAAKLTTGGGAAHFN
jgi:hypothetical protein